jgi:type II secretory pathway pseudopilin PulG
MSLTELCVAVAIMLTAAAISTPSLLRAREVYVLQSTARMVESRMQSARIQAVTRNRDCRLNVTSSTTYVVECQGSAWETIESITMPRAITIMGSARPEFHPHGNVAPTATLTLWDSMSHSVRVIVNVNGRVRIQ